MSHKPWTKFCALERDKLEKWRALERTMVSMAGMSGENREGLASMAGTKENL
jgi:hypothetical protein